MRAFKWVTVCSFSSRGIKIAISQNENFLKNSTSIWHGSSFYIALYPLEKYLFCFINRPIDFSLWFSLSNIKKLQLTISKWNEALWVISKEVKNVCVMAWRTMPKEIYDDVAQLKVLISHLPLYPAKVYRFTRFVF